MSTRDKDLVDTLGMPLSEVARSVGKHDYSVRRGINSEKDFFTPADVLKVFEHFRSKEPKIAHAFAKRIISMFPEMDGLIDMDQSDTRPQTAPHARARISGTALPEAEGEYWVLCASFQEAKGFNSALDELMAVVNKSKSNLSLFVPWSDVKNWQNELKRRNLDERSTVYSCRREELALSSFLVVFTSHVDGDVTLIRGDITGLTVVSDVEALRIKDRLSELAEHPYTPTSASPGKD